jgi:hypothetical protein
MNILQKKKIRLDLKTLAFAKMRKNNFYIYHNVVLVSSPNFVKVFGSRIKETKGKILIEDIQSKPHSSNHFK